MSRLSIITRDKAQATVETLYKDLERRIIASPPGLCPIDLASSFLKMCHAQTCGKCVPCRIGLGQLEKLLEDVLNGEAELETIDLIEKTARTIYYSADCAIGYEAANMVLQGIKGFRDDFEEHILRGRCNFGLYQPVPCVSLCPAGVDVPGYIALISEGRYEDAVKLIMKDNPMPATCALVCEHPCETRCRRNMIDKSINIRGLKRFAVEHAGVIPAKEKAPSTGKKVAIVGGGPSGLSAAYYLSIMGHDVEIFEQRQKLGGMLRYGIPSYRLPRDILDKEIETILSTGIKAHTGVIIGKDLSTKDLKERFDAIYIAIGAHIDKKIGLEGQEAEGVISAVEVLRQIGDDEYPDFTDKSIVVIGGGNVAIDVARSAVRLGAKKVSIVYRRRKVDMPAMDEEVEGAIAEGCEIYDLYTPGKIEMDDNGHIKALWVQPQMVGTIVGGRPIPVEAKKDTQRIDCDTLIVAIGQGIESKSFEKDGIPVTKGVIDALNWGGIKDIPGVYAGGDCVSGPATVIRAIAAGKVAAANIDNYLGYYHVIESDVNIPEARLADRIPCGRVNMRERDVSDRIKDFDLVEYGMTCEEANQESKRCLRCDHFGFGVFKGGRIEKW
ncbi:NAD(P)-binding protein [Clostridium sp. Cult2]|uniref:NAD(P)-binding protein n=1 Tax=Clostridium sp. Cult2 TaxID=2079003 RepID=UPI001EEEBDBD|nr:NAD(P)-binding protein [Clostridium sp. Cult2]MCF6465307.1 glutamate synthase [Clostridium sp. Cult2]